MKIYCHYKIVGFVTDIYERDLCDYCNSRDALSEEEACNIFRQLISALEYLHSIGIFHKRISLENIILSSPTQVKLIGFSHAEYINSSNPLPNDSFPFVYSSPQEVAGKNEEKMMSDIWQLGGTLYALVGHRLPFFDGSFGKSFKNIKTGNYKKLDVSEELQDLISRMLTVDPKQRITLSEIKQHPWFIRGLKVDEPLLSTEEIKCDEPIDVSNVDPSFIQNLYNIGISEDDIQKQLASEETTPSKVFVTLMKKNSK